MQIPFFPPKPPQPPDQRNGLELLLAECIRQIAELREEIRDLHDTTTQQGTRLMATVQQYAERITAHLDRIDANVQGIDGDVTGLTAEVAALRESLGQLTPEQEALMSGLETRVGSIGDRVEALNALTPPAVPQG